MNSSTCQGSRTYTGERTWDAAYCFILVLSFPCQYKARFFEAAGKTLDENHRGVGTNSRVGRKSNFSMETVLVCCFMSCPFQVLFVVVRFKLYRWRQREKGLLAPSVLTGWSHPVLEPRSFQFCASFLVLLLCCFPVLSCLVDYMRLLYGRNACCCVLLFLSFLFS